MPLSRLGIARDHVEVYVGIDHHQHEVIDALVGAEGGEPALRVGQVLKLP